jgi:hypothetical protein
MQKNVAGCEYQATGWFVRNLLISTPWNHFSLQWLIDVANSNVVTPGNMQSATCN